MDNINQVTNTENNNILDYLKTQISLLLDSSAREKWIRYVDVNSNSDENIKLLTDVASMLLRVKKGENIDNLEKELAEKNPDKKTMVSTVFKNFASDVLVDLNKPTYQEDYNVTTEVSLNERIDVKEEVTEVSEEVEPVFDREKIAKDIYDYIKRPDVSFENIPEILDIYARVIKGAPCDIVESKLNDIVEFKGKKSIRRSVIANSFINDGYTDLCKMVLEDPQGLQDVYLNSQKGNIEEKFNNKYVDGEGKPIKIPKM